MSRLNDVIHRVGLQWFAVVHGGYFEIPSVRSFAGLATGAVGH